MKPLDLADIRKRVKAVGKEGHPTWEWLDVVDDVKALLAEIDRLHAEAATLWARGHGSRVCAAECHEEVVSCTNCGEQNPYLEKP